MCGIIAYRGHKNATELVLEGLKKLEYRGYDSWGVFYNNQIHRQVGKICESKNLDNFASSKLSLGHTRWATHGKVNSANSHPQVSGNNEIVLVQNGIVENYQDLKKQLSREGYKFKSETDTEIIANLVEKYFCQSDGLVEAVRLTMNDLKGRNAIVVTKKNSDEIVAARNGSPLIVGIDKGGYFVASDIPAFLNHTRKVNYLDDGEMVVINKNGIKFFNLKDGDEIQKRLIEIDWDAEEVEKGEHDHFMIKEIMDQKDTLYRLLQHKGPDIANLTSEINKAKNIFAVACGTAGYASMIGSYYFAQIANKQVNFVPASEFGNFKNFFNSKTLMVVTTQSGETVDVLEAMEIAKGKGVKIAGVVNVAGSSIARKSDLVFHINAGPEKAVASTKATTSQIAAWLLFAFSAIDELKMGRKILAETAGQVNDMLNPRYIQHIHNLAEQLKDCEHLYVIGRGMQYPLALEFAHKIKEVSYIHAEGFAGGELKHGTIALIDKGTPCFALVANDENKEAIVSNAIEIKSRGGYIIGVAPESNDVFDYFIKVPDAGLAAPIVNLIPGQIIAYQLAVLRGKNPDQPRNLAKSVTVK